MIYWGSLKLCYCQKWFLSVLYHLSNPQALANHMAQLHGQIQEGKTRDKDEARRPSVTSVQQKVKEKKKKGSSEKKKS